MKNKEAQFNKIDLCVDWLFFSTNEQFLPNRDL